MHTDVVHTDVVAYKSIYFENKIIVFLYNKRYLKYKTTVYTYQIMGNS